MYLIVCLRKFIQKIVDTLLKRLNTKDTSNKTLNPVNKSLFTDKQMYWIDKGLEAGIDITVYAKPKYTPRQMQLILYAICLKVDLKDIANYCLSETEMEYNLYLGCIERYLGKNYLTKLLNKGKYSIADSWVQTLIKEQLNIALSESSCTIETPEVIHLRKLRLKCEHRNINPYVIELGTIIDMNSRYLQEEAKLRDAYLSSAVDIDVLKKPISISQIVINTDLTKDDIPVYVYRGNEVIATYYTVISKYSILLIGRGLQPLRLKRS